MATTDEELKKKQEDVAKLRQKIIDTREAEARKVQEASNDIEMKLLEREEQRFQAELDSIEVVNKTEQKKIIETAVSGPTTEPAPADTDSDKE